MPRPRRRSQKSLRRRSQGRGRPGRSRAVHSRKSGGGGPPLLSFPNAPPAPPSQQPEFQISFPSGATATPDGPILSKADAIPEPDVRWDQPTPPTLLSFLCWDPDAPAANWVHWLVINCSGSGPESGKTILPWAPPTPPSGQHRYVFGLFRHMTPITIDMKERAGFSLSAFLEQGAQLVAYKGVRVNAAG